MEQVNTFTRQLGVNYANIKHISDKSRNQGYTFRHEECLMVNSIMIA